MAQVSSFFLGGKGDERPESAASRYQESVAGEREDGLGVCDAFWRHSGRGHVLWPWGWVRVRMSNLEEYMYSSS